MGRGGHRLHPPTQRCDLGSHSLRPSVRFCCKWENSSGLADLCGDERGCGQLPWALDSHLTANEPSSVHPAQALPSSHPFHGAETAFVILTQSCLARGLYACVYAF